MTTIVDIRRQKVKMIHLQLSERLLSNSPGLVNLSSSFTAIQRRTRNLSVQDLRLCLYNMLTPSELIKSLLLARFYVSVMVCSSTYT